MESYCFDRPVDRRGTRSAKWSHPGLLPLWVADMDFEAPEAVREAILSRASHNVYGYDRPPEGYFDAFAGWLKRRQNFPIREEWVIPASGVVQALHLLIHALTLPGDGVVIQPPVYHPFARAILESGRQLVTNPLIRRGDTYEIDLNDLEEKLSQPRVKLLVLCNPHNPVGRVYTREELKAVGDLALKHRVFVISDEIHGDLILPSHTHIPFATLSEEITQNCAICTAPSKTFNLAGLATSNIIIPNDEHRDRFARLNQSLGIHGGSMYGFIACEAAYRHGEPWLDQLIAYLNGNAQFFQRFVAESVPRVTADELQGTYLQWVDFRALRLDDGALESLIRDRAGLWVSQGYIFGKEGSGFARFNLATQRKTLRQALERLQVAVASL